MNEEEKADAKNALEVAMVMALAPSIKTVMAVPFGIAFQTARIMRKSKDPKAAAGMLVVLHDAIESGWKAGMVDA